MKIFTRLFSGSARRGPQSSYLTPGQRSPDPPLRAARVPALAALVVGLTTLLAPDARAQSVSNEGAAELLFREGVELMKSEEFKPACEKFAASQELDPTIGTTLYLADCYEQIGKVASAWSLFRIAEGKARSARHEERAEIAAKRAARLTERLSYITVVVSFAELKGLRLTLGEKNLPKPAWGKRVPIDPGSSSLRVEAPGHEAWSTRIFIRPRGSSRVIVSPLRPVAKPVPLPARAAQTAQETSSASAWGWVVGGAGVVALGTGGVLGLRASSLNAESEQECRTQNLCSTKGVALRQNASGHADAASIALGAGALLVATGSVMLFAFDSGDDPASDSALTGLQDVAIGLEPYISGLGVQLQGAW